MGTETERLARAVRAEAAHDLREAETEAQKSWETEPIDPSLPTVVAIDGEAGNEHGALDEGGLSRVSEALRRVFELELTAVGAMNASRGDRVVARSDGRGDHTVTLVRGGRDHNSPWAAGTVLEFQRVSKAASVLRIAAFSGAHADSQLPEAPRSDAPPPTPPSSPRYAFTAESGLAFSLVIEMDRRAVRIEGLPREVTEARLTSVESGVVVVVRTDEYGLWSVVGEPEFSDLLADIGSARARIQLEPLQQDDPDLADR
jgi:hypothetical protein